uniref:FCH domain-containing protein n=1 Tax=Cyprinodon variegatus TaxID=28743 RepID=A0A3Q2DKI9_CYPVA
ERPPVKESQQLKVLFSEQLSKLQSKQQQDTELLEEIRSFSKQRAAIEKEYGQVRTSISGHLLPEPSMVFH